MAKDTYNIIPVTFAVILHVVIFGSLVTAWDWSRAEQPRVPLAIKASLITDELPPVIEIPDPEPEPVREEPPPPDPDEEARIKAEEAKRLQDMKDEQDRLAQIERDKREAERKRAEEEAERKRLAELELERKRAEAERKRQEEIERQREENRRQEQELLDQQRLAMLEAENEAMELQDSTEMQIYQALITQKVKRNWARPGTARDDLSCVAVVEQITGGEVIGVRIGECNGDEIVRRSIEAAVRRASPLPTPENPLLFLRTFEIEFTIDD